MITSNKSLVVINLLPSTGGLELIEYDSLKGGVKKQNAIQTDAEHYSHRILNRGNFKNQLAQLYKQSGVSKKHPVVFVLPGFYTRELLLPQNITEDEKNLAIEADAENFFLFENQEASVSYINLQDDRILYSAYLKSEINFIAEVAQQLNINIINITLNYTTILKGLTATGTIEHQLENNEKWALIVVSNAVLFAGMLEGTQWFKVLERPLSSNIAQSDDEKLIKEIAKDLKVFIKNRSFSKIILINNSSIANVESLSETLETTSQPIIIHQNSHYIESLKNLVPSLEYSNKDIEFPCTLEVLGGAFIYHYPEIQIFNFNFPKIKKEEDTAETEIFLLRLVSIFFMAAIGLSLFASFTLEMVIKEKELSLKRLENKLHTLSEQPTYKYFDDIAYQRLVLQHQQHQQMLMGFLVKLPQIKNVPESFIETIDIENRTGENQYPKWTIKLSGQSNSLNDIETINQILDNAKPDEPFRVSNTGINTKDNKPYRYKWNAISPSPFKRKETF